ncbi:MAG: hypothetical protein HFE33_06330 [Clostridia bacterium]|jgi:hypothetical protein|nr:hypothetical protein [Clostridia bacterium]MCI8945270.1 hypothetical protein [Clostridia bacterium]MDE6885350.1 hypothetical protein [Clostridia bacterium]
MKIWARLVSDDKIKKDTLYSSPLKLSKDNYELWLRDICHILDVPNPVLLDHHFKNFVNFHNTKFRQDDFVETLDYDIFIVEDCKED